MENIAKPLHVRSDGWAETSDGLFAVTMKVKTGVDADGVCWFSFVPGFNTQAVRIEWMEGDLLQVFPDHIANVLVNRGYATVANQNAVDWYNKEVADPAPTTAPTAPTTAPKEDPTPTPTEAKAEPTSEEKGATKEEPAKSDAPWNKAKE